MNQHPRKQILRPKLDYFEANHHNIKSKTTHAGLEMSSFKNNKILLKAKGKTAKPHVCGFCLKPFRQRYHLIQHQRLHTGERPFQCSTCSRAYTSKNKLRDHCRTFGHLSEHFDTAPQVANSLLPAFGYLIYDCAITMRRSCVGAFQCSTCSRGYTSKNKLRDHCRTFGHLFEHFYTMAQVTS